MKISQLIELLGKIKEANGDMSVYLTSWSGHIMQPDPYISFGGSTYLPYPGLYLN